MAKERERLIQEQQAWIIELERGKAWLEEQWTNCKRLAEGREQAIGQQSEQIAAFKKELLFLQSTMARWQNNFWVRLGLRLANLKQPGGIQNEKNQEMNQ